MDKMSYILRAISSGLKFPVIIILVIMTGITIILLGSLVAEFFAEHRCLKGSMPE